MEVRLVAGILQEEPAGSRPELGLVDSHLAGKHQRGLADSHPVEPLLTNFTEVSPRRGGDLYSKLEMNQHHKLDTASFYFLTPRPHLLRCAHALHFFNFLLAIHLTFKFRNTLPICILKFP